MSTLIGRYEYSVDPKNRIFLPPRYREHLSAERAKHFILSVGMDDCLYLFLPSQWERLITQSKETIQLKNKTKQRAVKRHLFSNAHEVDVDDQGRILIPPMLKTSAGIRREVVVVGVGDKAEIWDKARHLAKSKAAEKIFRQMSADLDL